jgi:hypothetical protein
MSTEWMLIGEELHLELCSHLISGLDKRTLIGSKNVICALLLCGNCLQVASAHSTVEQVFGYRSTDSLLVVSDTLRHRPIARRRSRVLR